MKTLCVLFFVCCALGALADENGCSLSLNGTRLVLDRFLNKREDKGLVISEATFEAWIRPFELEANTSYTPGEIMNTGRILGSSSSPLSSQALIYDYAQQKVRVEVYREGNETSHSVMMFYTTTQIPIGRWTHVAMYIGNSTHTLYVDGLPVELTQEDPTQADYDKSPSHRFSIGGGFVGEIDEVKVWNRVRAPVMDGCDSDEGLILYLPFNECSGNITADYSESASCGKIQDPSKLNWEDWQLMKAYKKHYKKHHHDDKKRHHDREKKNKIRPYPFFLETNAPQPTLSDKREEERRREDDDSYKRHHDYKKKWREHHKHGDHHECRGLSAISFGAPAPTTSCAKNLTVVDIEQQCPYSAYYEHRHHHHGHHGYHDDDDFEGMCWTGGFALLVLFAAGFALCFVCKRRRCRNRAAASAAASAYTRVPTEETSATPSFVVNVADGDYVQTYDGAVPLEEQPFLVYPAYTAHAHAHAHTEAHTQEGGGAQPVMYYMPQPVFYAPNMERDEEGPRQQ